MNILVLGGGFVGLTTACTLAENNHQVSLYEVDPIKSSKIASGEVPFYEPGITDLLQNLLQKQKIKVLQDFQQSKLQIDMAVLCVGTPELESGEIDLTQVISGINLVLKELDSNVVICIKSSIVPGSYKIINSMFEHVHPSPKIAIVPEFLREGTALNDARNPDRVVIGTFNSDLYEIIELAFSKNTDKVVRTTPFNAEAIKYVSNSFLATCISFTNEVFNYLTSHQECSVSEILQGWHGDNRFKANSEGQVGLTKYLVPGPGFGGSCFPKDVKALSHVIAQAGDSNAIIRRVLRQNEEMPNSIVDWLSDCIPANEKVLVVGVAFKESTSDLRESPGIKILRALSARGYDATWYDEQFSSITEQDVGFKFEDIATSGADYLVLVTHNLHYRLVLEEHRNHDLKTRKRVFALRFQEPISNYIWHYPKQKKDDEYVE